MLMQLIRDLIRAEIAKAFYDYEHGEGVAVEVRAPGARIALVAKSDAAFNLADAAAQAGGRP